MTIAAGLIEKEINNMGSHLGAAPHRAIWSKRDRDGKVLSIEIMANPFLSKKSSRGRRLVGSRVKKGRSFLRRNDMESRGPEYVFSNAEDEIRRTGSKWKEREAYEGCASGARQMLGWGINVLKKPDKG